MDLKLNICSCADMISASVLFVAQPFPATSRSLMSATCWWYIPCRVSSCNGTSSVWSSSYVFSFRHSLNNSFLDVIFDPRFSGFIQSGTFDPQQILPAPYSGWFTVSGYWTCDASCCTLWGTSRSSASMTAFSQFTILVEYLMPGRA